MSSTITFPDEASLQAMLFKHKLLNTDYNKEKGITKAVAELAAKRFANRELVEMGVEMSTMLLVHDLLEGKDGFTGKSLTNLGELGLPDFFWNTFSISIEKALMDCAKNSNKEMSAKASEASSKNSEETVKSSDNAKNTVDNTISSTNSPQNSHPYTKWAVVAVVALIAAVVFRLMYRK